MTSYVTPKKNAAFVTYVSLEDQANAGLFKASPTLAAGDFKVSIDGGALANLATLPTNTPASSTMVKISLSADEMNGDNITVVCKDAAGAEWYDLVLNIQTSARQVDDLAYPATSGRALTVAATGEAEANVTMQAGIAVAQQPTDASIAAAVAAQFASDGIVVVTEGATAEDLYDDLAALHGANSWEGLTAQETANAALLTPVGVSAEGSQIDYLASLPADVDTELSATHGAGSWAGGGGAGSGTGVYTDTLESPSGTPVDGARVTLATDVDGENVAYEARTDAFGVFEMRPDPGTYYRFIEAAGHTFVQGVEVEVTEP